MGHPRFGREPRAESREPNWAYLRGTLCTGLRQLPSAIDGLALPDAWELLEYWNEWPPEHMLLRGFTGYKPPSNPGCELGTEEVASLTGMLGPAERPPQHINELVEWAEKMKEKL